MDNILNNLAPFYKGQKVVGSNEVSPNSFVKKGNPYTIRHCESRINPANGLGPFWYVGIEENTTNDWLSPRLFTPLEESPFPSLTMSKVIEKEKVLISMN